ncbi:MAG: methyl-accepting chemotaxis protein [Chloroflexota bacterium]
MKLWQRLVTPNPNFSPDKHRRAQLHNTIVLLLAIVIVLYLPLPQLGGFNLIITLFLLAGFILCLVAYGLSRLGWVTQGAIILFLWLLIGVVSYIAVSEDRYFISNLRGVTPILAIPILATGVIISPIFSLLVAVAGAICISVVAFARSKVGFPDLETTNEVIAQLSVPVVLLLVLAGLSWLFEHNIEELLQRLRSQNLELANTNQRLDQRRHEEHHLSQEINQLSVQVSNAFSSQTTGTSDQLSAVVEVTTTLEELSQTNQQIAGAASQVAESASHTLDVAERGSINIKESLEATILLSQRVQNMANAMNSLFDQARQIDQIIELINEVAEETNLLALNATIEAAGAREYGRRFAAVASEMQRLANRSRDATEQVRSVINEVQAAIRASAEISKVGLEEAFQIVGRAHKAEGTIEEMVEMVQHTTSLAQQISLAIQQQRSASSQVVDTMRQISEVSYQMASNSHLLLEAVNQLYRAANQLRDKTI